MKIIRSLSDGIVPKITTQVRSFLALGLCLILAAGITYILYNYTQSILVERLQEKLIAIVSTAATEIEASDVEAVRSSEDIAKPQYQKMVRQLNEIRAANENIKFAYIMRRTDSPSFVEFVADADALSSTEELDENQNGIIDEDEMPPQPGDPYETADYPVLKDEAFYHPSVDRELQPDQWGLIMAAYAPILDENNNTVAIIGIDVIVDDFKEKTQETLAPFLLFILFLILLLSLLTSLLVRFYGERVHALQEVDRQKDELMSIVSHQLATPVSSVKWYLEMLLDGDVGKLMPEQVEYLKTMQSVTRDLADLVSMILDVSRIQLGRMKVDPQSLDVGKFVKEILDVIEPKAAEKKVKFVKDIPPSLPSALWDKRLTRMTLENLLSNAIKYTPEGGDVKLTIKEQPNGMIYFEVKDTGCGIPEKEKDKMFQKQYRASNVGSIEGNGFGLYVAKGAVESQGGKIWFESTEGKGTTFMFEMPLGSSEKPNA